ncbi:plasma membrane proteolipid Pmp3 [Cadophora gregata]|uniref:plasma membrane proteolipid Pmp3 n=1 Tax=Cadophora gregata TaxID=51156 RepID=UPI0026DDCB73|nr:plasma membrane proteolipid Pmp3 [Cadophora gregata]KAK0107349.1 plasma membrane proteolipid Pmp3 [Cadophora gregata]
MAFTASDICKIILAVILPPLGVFLERGCGADLLINILLTILGYIPGIIHALYVHSTCCCTFRTGVPFPFHKSFHTSEANAGVAFSQSSANVPYSYIILKY